MNKHRIGALLAAAALTLSFAGTSLAAVTYATVTGHTAFSEDANKADFWGTTCTKTEFTGEDETYLLDKDYALVVVKSGTGEFANTEFENAKAGETVFADTNGNGSYDPEGPEDKAISHIIFCEAEETTTTSDTETTDTSTTTTDTTTSTTTTDTTASETSSTTSKETTPEGSVEELTPPHTDVLGQPTSSSTVPTGVLLVLAGLLAAALVVIPAAARRR